jgi:uncharacterized damage-inducible protein DinB
VNLRDLMAYKTWANTRLFGALEQLDEGVLRAPQPIIFGSLLSTLHHVVVMDRVWQAHLLGEAHGYTSRVPQPAPPIEELWAWQQQLDGWYQAQAAAMEPADEAECISFEFIGGGQGRMSRAQIFQHVANHATYHRGHIAAMMYAAGAAPPTTDLPVFLRERE